MVPIYLGLAVVIPHYLACNIVWWIAKKKPDAVKAKSLGVGFFLYYLVYMCFTLLFLGISMTLLKSLLKLTLVSIFKILGDVGVIHILSLILLYHVYIKNGGITQELFKEDVTKSDDDDDQLDMELHEQTNKDKDLTSADIGRSVISSMMLNVLNSVNTGCWIVSLIYSDISAYLVALT